MTVTTVQHNADGSMTSAAGAGVSSSADAPHGEGYHIRSGMHGGMTHDLSNVADTDIITIQGMELQYGQAKQMGLISPHVPDAGLNKGSAAQQVAPEVETPTGSNTGYEDYDAAANDLTAQVEAGTMQHSEAIEYDTAFGQVALSGMTINEAAGTLEGLKDGSIDPNAINADQRQVVENLEKTVHTAATKSVVAELGQEGFNRLAEIAKGDAEFAQILTGYATQRALGQADHSWSEFLDEAESWSRGNR